MAVYGSSLGGEEAEADQDAGFQKALDAAIDPALEMCVSAAEEKKRARPAWDASVFVLNCLTYMQVSLQPSPLRLQRADGKVTQGVLEQHPFAAEKCQMIDGIMQGKVDELIEEHVSFPTQSSVIQAGSPRRHRPTMFSVKLGLLTRQPRSTLAKMWVMP